MRISYSRPGTDSLVLDFAADSQDAVPPLDRVRIAAPHLGRLREPRAALLGYLLVRDLVGNRLEFRGIRIPTFLAGSILRQSAQPELFVEGLTNAVEALAPRAGARLLAWGVRPTDAETAAEPAVEPAAEAGMLRVTADALGYRIAGDGAACEIRSNLRLFLALAARRPDEVEPAALALLACDLLGASRLHAGPSEPGGGVPPGLAALLGDVGFSLEAPAEAAA